MDAFSEILSGVKLNGAVYFNASFTAPWGVTAPASRTMAAALAPGAAHLILYHLLLEGAAFAQIPGERPVELQPGEVVVFPHGDAHHMMSARDAQPPFPSYGINAKVKARDLTPLQAGGGGAATRFVAAT